MAFLGEMHFKGQGVAANATAAMSWFRRAAELDDATAMAWIGLLHAMGEEIEQDFGEAAVWYRRAMEHGSVESMFRLGLMHLEGLGVPQDRAEGVALVERAAAAGNQSAKVHLALWYEEGKLRPRDLDAVERSLRGPSFLGNSWAMAELGRIRANRGEVEEGVTLLSEAIEAGFELGYIYRGDIRARAFVERRAAAHLADLAREDYTRAARSADRTVALLAPNGCARLTRRAQAALRSIHRPSSGASQSSASARSCSGWRRASAPDPGRVPGYGLSDDPVMDSLMMDGWMD